MYRAGLKIVFVFVKSYDWKFIKCFGSKMKISRIQYKSLSKANVIFSNTRLIYNITAEHFKLNFSRVKLLTRKWPKLANIPPFLWISSVFDSLSPKGNFLLLRERFQTRPPWTTWFFCFMNMDLNFKSPRTKSHNVLHSFAYHSAEKKMDKNGYKCLS